VRALGKIAIPEANQSILEALKDEDEGVLIEAVRIMGEKRMEDGIPLLENLYQNTELDRVKLACAVALTRMNKGEEYLAYLISVVNGDSDWGARLSAVMGLREMEYKQVESELRKALDDTHWLVQKAAARSLLFLHDEELYATLESFLGDEEEDIMQAVIETSFFEMLELSDEEESELED